MNLAFRALLAGVVVTLAALFSYNSEAQLGPGDFGFHHHENHDWYKDLTAPKTGWSCCNGTSEDSSVVGDCRPTKAYKVGDTWMALIDGEWYPVPQDIIIKSDKNHEPYQAHICASKSRNAMGVPYMYCFIEKEGGT